MRILFLSAYFEPEVIPSSYLGANKREALASLGYEMIVFTPAPTRGISDEVRKCYKKKSYEEKYSSRLKIHRFPMFRESSNTILRAIRYFLCNIIQFFIGITQRNIDVICVASTPPTQGALAGLIKFFTNTPIIYDLQDIFPDSLVNAGMTKKGSLIWKIGRLIEDFSYKQADKIIVISEDFCRNITLKGVPVDKITVIHNWADEASVFNLPRSQNPLYEELNLSRDNFYVVYSGNIGFSQNFDLLLEVAEKIKRHSRICFLIFGDGSYKSTLNSKINERGLQNIKVFPYQPYENIAQVFGIGDVYLIISKKNIGSSSVPSKTWNIMAAEKPVISSFDLDSDTCRLIELANCGICVPPDDVNALADGIYRFFTDQDLAISKGQNGKRFLEDNLSKNSGISKYLELFTDFVPKTV